MKIKTGETARNYNCSDIITASLSLKQRHYSVQDFLKDLILIILTSITASVKLLILL